MRSWASSTVRPAIAGDDVARLEARLLGRAAGEDRRRAVRAFVDQGALFGRQVKVGGHLLVDHREVDTDPRPAISSPARARAMIGFAKSIGMANPMPCASVETAVLMPMTWPALLTSGPPELPGLMAASVWIRLFSCSGS